VVIVPHKALQLPYPSLPSKHIMTEQESQTPRMAEQESQISRMAEQESQISRMAEQESQISRMAEQESQISRMAEQESQISRMAEQESQISRHASPTTKNRRAVTLGINLQDLNCNNMIFHSDLGFPSIITCPNNEMLMFDENGMFLQQVS